MVGRSGPGASARRGRRLQMASSYRVERSWASWSPHADSSEQVQTNYPHATGTRPKMPDSIGLCGGACYRSSKVSRGEDLEVEQPVPCRDCAAFHFHATLAGMPGPTLIRH